MSKIAKDREMIRMTQIKALKAGEGFKLLDDFEVIGVVDNTRDAYLDV